jgi:carboxyl-terminal processing protease
MNRWLRCGLVLFLIALILVTGVAGGVLLDRQVLSFFSPPANIPSGAESEFRLMAQAWNTIQDRYVNRAEIEQTDLAYGAISGMMNSLGDVGHSRFLTPQMAEQQRNFGQGEFEGIGVEVQMRDGRLVIVAPIDNTPAAEAGLQPGDVIVAVDGEDVTGMALEDIVQRIMGPAGTEVTLRILDPDTGQTREVTLTRARIPLENVSWAQLPGTQVAHVRISAFSRGVTADLKNALNAIKDQGLSGIILDLRNNPGGLLDEAVGTASQFLEGGNVLLVRDAEGNVDPVPVEDGGLASELPLVVLINEGSASASEIVAGALQDQDRATLVGQTTFGTGTVLSTFRLSDGSALLLATEEWLTPAGRVIWRKGIEPGVQVSLPSGAAPLVPDAERDMSAQALQDSQDAQLLQALEVLSGSIACQPQLMTCPGALPLRSPGEG